MNNYTDIINIEKQIVLPSKKEFIRKDIYKNLFLKLSDIKLPDNFETPKNYALYLCLLIMYFYNIQ